MRLQFFESGLVDEVAARGTLEVERTGDARYVLRVRGENEIDVAMWTTRRSCIVARPWPEPPSWLTLVCGPDDVLESLRAEEGFVHLEHMDRGLYYLGLSRDREEPWGLLLGGPRYIQTRMLSHKMGVGASD